MIKVLFSIHFKLPDESECESMNDEEMEDSELSSSEVEENETEDFYSNDGFKIPLNILLPRTFYFDKFFNTMTKLEL